MPRNNPLEDPAFVVPATVEAAADGLKLLTFPDGFRCYTHSNEQEAALIYNEIFVKQEYLTPDISLEEYRCVFDVGANIGLFTLFCKMRNPGLVVHAFEPIEVTYNTLVKNIELHGLTNVHCHNAALGAGDGAEHLMTYYPNAAGNSTANPESKEDLKRHLTGVLGAEKAAYLFQSAQVHTVRTRTLSAIVAEAGITAIDLLKIDTEGDEQAVLKGISDEHYPMIRRIVGEVHGDVLPGEIQSLLSRKGFQVSWETGIAGGINSNLVAVRK